MTSWTLLPTADRDILNPDSSRIPASVHVATLRAVGASALFHADIPFPLQLVEGALHCGDADLEITRHPPVADVAEIILPLPVAEVAEDRNSLCRYLIPVDHFECSHPIPPFWTRSYASENDTCFRWFCFRFPAEPVCGLFIIAFVLEDFPIRSALRCSSSASR